MWKKIDNEEFVAFIGLIMLASVEKYWNFFVRKICSDPPQNLLYKATMAV